MKTSILALSALVVAAPAVAQVMTPADYVKTAGVSDLYERQSSQIVLQSTQDPKIRSFAQHDGGGEDRTGGAGSRRHAEDDVAAVPIIDAGDLAIAYREQGTGVQPPVLLLHGWPDYASTWDEAAPVVAGAGRRLIVPTFLGFGDTQFRDNAAPRAGNSAMHAIDMIAFLEALGIQRFAVVGHDWGFNIAEALAVGWPERVKRLAMLATPPRLDGMPTPPFKQAQRYWYHGSWRRHAASRRCAPIRTASRISVG